MIADLNWHRAWLQAGIFTIMAIAIMWVLRWLGRRQGIAAVTQWALENQYLIVSIHQPFFVPLWRLGHHSGHQFFRATLRDATGVTRQCWLRCPDTGSNPTEVEVIWK